MEITLEKIELVKDRTGASYKDAKEALEKTGGSVVDAIILIEDAVDQPETKDSAVRGMLDKVKAAIHKGNVSKVSVKKDDETVLNIPVNVGIVGSVLFPWAVVAGIIAALGTKCMIEILKSDGEVINVSGKANEVFDSARSKGAVIAEELKDKGGDIFQSAVSAGSDLAQTAKEKGRDAFEVVKDKSKDAFEVVMDKSKDAFEVVKDKGRDAYESAVEKINSKQGAGDADIADFGDFDLSDLDLSQMEAELSPDPGEGAAPQEAPAQPEEPVQADEGPAAEPAGYDYYRS